MSTIAPPESEARPLTERQAEVFRYLYEFTRTHGYQPSSQELCGHFGFTSKVSACHHIGLIAAKGWIQKATGVPRAIRFLCRPDGSPFTGFADLSP